MVTPIDELKVRAKKLLKSSATDSVLQTLSKGRPIQLKHCQLYLARQLGFQDWSHASSVLECGNAFIRDYGTFWYKDRCAISLNYWCKTLSEAKALLHDIDGVVLPFKNQFFVAPKSHFINLGMKFDSSLWQQLDRNWLEGDSVIRQSLALQRIVTDGVRVKQESEAPGA